MTHALRLRSSIDINQWLPVLTYHPNFLHTFLRLTSHVLGMLGMYLDRLILPSYPIGWNELFTRERAEGRTFE